MTPGPKAFLNPAKPATPVQRQTPTSPSLRLALKETAKTHTGTHRSAHAILRAALKLDLPE